MESENCQALHARVIHTPDVAEEPKWRRHCGCLRTSEKLREIIKGFPSAPPPTPSHVIPAYLEMPRIVARFDHNNRLATYYTNPCPVPYTNYEEQKEVTEFVEAPKVKSRTWQVVYELVQLVQLSVTATALALYYLIYCYMQLVYYTLRSALYFHHADGPMKITIGVVTVTSIIVGFNLIIRMEKLMGYAHLNI